MRDHAYADRANLDARRALWTYTVEVDPPDEPGGRVRAVLALRGPEVVIDVGCGNGHDLAPLADSAHQGPLIGIDLSLGMVSEIHPARVHRVQGDAMALPLTAASADVVCAFHMLYHVFDIDTALGEIRRILKPGGTFVCSTNSSEPNEIVEVWSAAFSAVLGRPVEVVRSAEARFNLEDAPALLERRFSSVRLRTRRSRVEVPDAEVVVGYVQSVRPAYESLLPSAEAWDEATTWLRRRVEAEIAERGFFEVHATSGIFACV